MWLMHTTPGLMPVRPSLFGRLISEYLMLTGLKDTGETVGLK